MDKSNFMLGVSFRARDSDELQNSAEELETVVNFEAIIRDL